MPYGIDSLHVNVGQGDCAIHLLLDNTWTRSVSRAVLIDGGPPGGQENIRKTIKQIQEGPWYGVPDKELRFDVIIITHWDDDHYGGIKGLFQDEIKEIKKKNKDIADKDIRLSFIKYENDKPTTVLYAPYWPVTTPPPTIPAAGGPGGDKGKKPKRPTGLKKIIPIDRGKCTDDVNDPNIYLKIGGAGRLCRVDVTKILGMNFLTGEKLPADKKPESITSPSVLVNALPPPKGQPGMYCVASEKVVLGPGGNKKVVDKLDPSQTNRSSICAMIIWETGHLSHYFGGDADHKTEIGVTKWSGTDGETHKVTSMKLSHHGSAYTTPVNILHGFNPENIIISAGDSTHLHPDWEVLLYLHAWAVTSKVGKKPVYSTQYPCYLSARTKPWSLNPATLEARLDKKKDKKRDDFATAFEKLVPSDTTSVFKEYKKFKDDYKAKGVVEVPEAEMDSWIIERVVQRWSTISPIGPESHPASSAAFAGSVATPVLNTKGAVEYIRVTSRETGPAGEDVWVKYANKPYPLPPIIIPPTVAVLSATTTPDPTGVIQHDPPSGGGTPTKKFKPDLTVSDAYSLGGSPSIHNGEQGGDESGSEMEEEFDTEAVGGSVRELDISQEEEEGESAEQGFYLVSGKLKATGHNTQALPAGDLNGFVTALHKGYFGLERKPTAGSKEKLLATDEWLLWLQDCAGATSFSATWNEAGTIGGFDLEIASLGSNMTFSTDFIDDAFGGENAVPAPGLLSDEYILVLGLDPSSSVKATLNDVVTYVGLNGSMNSIFLDLMGPVELAITPGKGAAARNAVWFEPRKGYRTTVRYQFNVHDFGRLSDLLGKIKYLELEVTSANVITKKISTWEMTSKGVVILHDAEITFALECAVKAVTFEAVLTFERALVSLDLTTRSEGVLGDIVEWLAKLVGLEDLGFTHWLKDMKSSSPQLRRISLGIDPGEHTIQHFSVDIEAHADFGIAKEDEPVIFLLTYSWSKGDKIGALKGALWCAPPKSSLVSSPKLMPDWEKHLVFTPLAAKQSETLSLKNMIPNGTISNIPKGIPDQICQASIEIDESGIAFSGALICSKPDDGNVPTFSLDRIDLRAKYAWATKDTESSFNVYCHVRALIETRPAPKPQAPAVILGTLEYDSGDWTLSASVAGLDGYTLYSFFDEDSRGGVMTFLEKLKMENLSLSYYYGKDQKASDFLFEGTVLLGKLALALQFTADENGWDFSASLGTTGTESSTIGDIITSITGTPLTLPEFVSSIPVSKADTGGLVKIDCQKTKDGGLQFTTSVRVGSFSFSFAQYRLSGWDTKVSPKRVIKVSVNQLPHVDVPIIGDLAQPFDEIFFMWVQDNSGQNGTGVSPGLTRAEVDAINEGLGDDKLLFRERKKEKERKQTDVVVEAGSHFVLVLKGENAASEVLIDYVFGKPTDPKSKPGKDSPEKETVGERPLDIKDDKTSPPPSDSSMAPYKKSIGPLSISNIGFQYKNGSLHVLLDAAFVLGPIGFTLLGFNLGVDLSGGFNLQKLPTKISASISGLAISFDRPPVIISGLFRYSSTAELEYYAGGVIVAFQPWLFEAAGFYGIVRPPGKPEYKSVFIFGKLNGPLITLGYAEISGITGGFGYNSHLQFPTIAEVPKFPFLAMDTAPESPMENLMELTKPGGWFSPRDGSFWLAAGLKVTAFQTLSIDAVVVVEWNPYVNLGIFGVAVAQIPRGGAITFAHVELGISATVDFRAGVMKLEAQLSPNSYIFSPSCHLTGGFGLYYWFEGSQFEGDWVFTIGGFHQAFKRPSHYPNPPRLAISWSLDSSLSITGEAYFAITPKVCMAGGRLHASLSLGPLDASFDAYADFLINYKPFHFMADGGISVGVRFTLDLWITTVHINVEIGARLHLVGPPMSGTVHVDFWVFGFDIDFGPGAEPPVRINLPAFYDLVLQSDIPGVLPAATRGAITGDENIADQAHVFGCVSGLIPTPDSGAVSEGKATSPETKSPHTRPWRVRGGNFSFKITSRFAINSAKMKNAIPLETNHEKAIYAKPMQLETPLDSSIRIQIEREDEVVITSKWKLDQLIKSVPNALWGRYNSEEDPSRKGNDISPLLGGSEVSTPHMMGVTITAPKPQHSIDNIPKFNAVKAMSLEVFGIESTPKFPPSEELNKTWHQFEDDAGTEQWGKVREAWTKPVVAQKETVDLWIKTFSWEATLSESVPLSGDMPPLLHKKFDEIYLSAPRLMVSSKGGSR